MGKSFFDEIGETIRHANEHARPTSPPPTPPDPPPTPPDPPPAPTYEEELAALQRKHGVAPKPQFTPNHSAFTHLRAALTYVNDVRKAGPLGEQDGSRLLESIDKAAQHLNQAKTADPNATIEFQLENEKEPHMFAQDEIARLIVWNEAIVAQHCAQMHRGDDYTGRQYLIRSKTALEKARKYGDSSSLRMSIAHTCKLLGDGEGAVTAARQALKLDPGNAEAIRFLDEPHDFQPIWLDTPDPAKEPIPRSPMQTYVMMMIGGGIGILMLPILEGAHAGPIIPFVVLASLGSLGFGVYRWWSVKQYVDAFKRVEEEEYQDYRQRNYARALNRIEDHPKFKDRFMREEEKRRRK